MHEPAMYAITTIRANNFDSGLNHASSSISCTELHNNSGISYMIRAALKYFFFFWAYLQNELAE